MFEEAETISPMHHQHPSSSAAPHYLRLTSLHRPTPLIAHISRHFQFSREFNIFIALSDSLELLFWSHFYWILSCEQTGILTGYILRNPGPALSCLGGSMTTESENLVWRFEAAASRGWSHVPGPAASHHQPGPATREPSPGGPGRHSAAGNIKYFQV